MLYAKISPAAQVVVQDGPTKVKVKEVEYMSISILFYDIGGKSVKLRVHYGDLLFDEEDRPIALDSLSMDVTQLTEEEIAQWGTDDMYIINLIAQKNGFEVVETLEQFRG